MSNLLKSKTLKFVIGLGGAVALFAGVTAMASYDFSTMSDMKLGTSNSNVMLLQQVLNMSPDTQVAATGVGSSGNETSYFGMLTQTAVKNFQMKNGITPVLGYVGKLTKAALNAAQSNVVSTNLPAGCTSTVGFSPINGAKCDTGTTTQLPAGCTSTVGFSPINGAKCDTGAMPNVVNNGPVSVALSMDNPAGGAVVNSSAANDMAHFTFTGSGTVTSLTLKRIGISADTSLSNVYLYEGSTRLTDASSVSSGSLVNFTNSSGLFTVNGSKTISVVVDLAASSGETIGVQLVSFTKTGDTSATSVGISGNLMSVASATLASVTFPGTITPSANTNLDPGVDTVVWQGTATVSTRDVMLKRIAFREVGSVNYSDIKNFRLYVDGVMVGSAVASLDSNGYVTFDTSASPMKLTTGSRTFKVVADVIGGSSRTFTFSIRAKTDVVLVDSQYGAGVLLGTSVPIAAGQQTVSSGSITVQKASDSPSGNITLNSSDAVLARYTFTAYGESVKLDTLNVQVVYTGSGAVTAIKNGRLLFNGQQYGSTTNISTSASTSFTVNTTVAPGTPTVVEVRGDISALAGTLSATDTLLARFNAGTTGNGQGVVSGTTSTVPAAVTSANSLTVKQGSMAIALTTNYPAQSTVVPVTAYKLGSYQITGSSTETINLNTFIVDFASVTGTSFAAGDLNNVYLMYNGVKVPGTKSTVSGTTLANTWSVSYVLPINGTAQIDVYGDVGSTVTPSDSLRTKLEVDGTTANSGVSLYTLSSGSSSTTSGSVYLGQVITYTAGSITSAKDSSASPLAKNLTDNTTNTSAAYKWTSTNDTYTITDVTFTLANATTVSQVVLKDGSTVLGTNPGAATVTFSGLNVPVSPSNTAGKTLTVDLILGNVASNGGGTSGEAVTVTLTSYTSLTSTGTSSTTSVTQAANAMYSYAALPVISTDGTGAIFSTGAQKDLYKFTVTSNGGTIGWNKITMSTTKSAPPIITALAMYDSANQSIPGYTIISGISSGAGTCNGSDASCTFVFVPTSEQQVSGSASYSFRGTVTNGAVNTDSISTNLASPTTTHTGPLAGFDYHTASGYVYYNGGSSNTAVDASDVRQTAAANYTTASVTATATAVGHNSVSKIQQAYYNATTAGTAGNGNMTLTLLEDASVADRVGALTFTVTGAGSTGVTCTPYTGTSGTGAVGATTALTAIQSVVCTGTGFNLAIFGIAVTADTGSDVGDGSLVIVITKGTDYAASSVVASTDADMGLTTTAGVAKAASLLWSDLSQSAHTTITSDWNDDYLVKNLPTTSYDRQ